MKIDINRVKIVVAIPLDSIDKVRNSLYESGAGIIGNYSCCSMMINCIGTFLPNKEATPYIGDNNKINFVEEVRLEVVCDVNIVKDVIKKLRDIHPYEEPAIDIIPLIDEDNF